jgi:hypothetical protein
MARAGYFQPDEFRSGPEERERWNLLGCGQHYELFLPPRNVLTGFLRRNGHPFLLLSHASQSLAVEFSCWPAFANRVLHCLQVRVVLNCLD